MARDYYKILGVDEKADKDEIKKKYRQLAKKYHPDRNQGDKAAEDKFKDISEAYDVLGDDKKRQQYDMMRRYGGFDPRQGGFPGGMHGGQGAGFGNGFGGRFNLNDLEGLGGLGDLFSSLFGENLRGQYDSRQFQRRQNVSRPGRNLRAEIKVTFFESLKGVTKKIRMMVPETCGECNGNGTVAGGGQKFCERCGGTGRAVSSQGAFTITRPCPVCLGRGVTPGRNCPSCRGTGNVKRQKTIKVVIPPLVEDGDKIRLKNLGFPGKNGGRKGDLIVKVKVMENQQFKREGKNIHTAVDISFPQAALGAKIPVKTLTGKIMLNIPAGTQPGAVMRLKGVGLSIDGAAGDLLVTINVIVPTKLTDRQKELLREFDTEKAAV